LPAEGPEIPPLALDLAAPVLTLGSAVGKIHPGICSLNVLFGQPA
jgi:hypothetical protein